MPAPFSELRDKLKDGSAGPAMVVLPGGSFQMGSPEKEKDHQTDEAPVHEVKLTAFALGRTEVTVGDYLRFVNATKTHYPEWLEPGNQNNIQTGSNDYYKKFGEALQAADHPIIGISWDDANAYAQWLSQQTGQTYRLPTEAQWEYAARAGSDKAYAFGDDPAKLGDYAWYVGNAKGKPHSVGSKLANAFGLYDMHGNVWEWTGDRFGNYPESSNSPEQDPIGPATGSRRVVRGGSLLDVAGDCRSAFRRRYDPSFRYVGLGFRLSRTLP